MLAAVQQMECEAAWLTFGNFVKLLLLFGACAAGIGLAMRKRHEQQEMEKSPWRHRANEREWESAGLFSGLDPDYSEEY